MAPELVRERLGDHLDRLYRAAWAMCGSREDAEDLVQDTYAKVLARPRRIDTDDPLPYLLTVLRNTHVSWLRTRARRPRTTELEVEQAGAVPGPIEAVASREVFAAIAELPAEFRDVIVAVDVAGLSYAEAAGALEVPQGTVMSRLYRGRDRLAKRLGA
jgi:RNA polymerase sigma-70 factor (ECF subfamily)